jgi:hypothetical protein
MGEDERYQFRNTARRKRAYKAHSSRFVVAQKPGLNPPPNRPGWGSVRHTAFSNQTLLTPSFHMEVARDARKAR